MIICISNPTQKPQNSILSTTRRTPRLPPLRPPFLPLSSISSSHQSPKISPANIPKSIKPNTHLIKPLRNPTQPTKPLLSSPLTSNNTHSLHVSDAKVLSLCGFGYWIQGFRCFPWLALNFQMAQGLSLHPSTLQLVQYSANLPMVGKPLYGVMSDAIEIGGARRFPYISFGGLLWLNLIWISIAAFLQCLSWGTLAVIPATGPTLPTQMVCILLSNLGASFTEVATDALITEFSKKSRAGELQSYAFMALAAGGILGNLSGGLFLQKTQKPKILFLAYCLLLSFQLLMSLTTRENTQCPDQHVMQKSISENLSKQFSNLLTAINEDHIFRPLCWVVASIAVVPMLSGTTFCYQMQCLKLDPSVIGLSKVIGQLMVLSATFFYNRNLKRIPMRKLICGVQIMYAISILSDFFLVTQINLRLGISNEAYVLCVSALAEAVAQFKILPFSVLFANVCPRGCEGSLIAFLASALCLSSIFSGLLGVGLACLTGISSENYSSLPFGILLQFVAALVPLGWISHIPISQKLGRVRKRSKRRRRMSLLPAGKEKRRVEKPCS